MSRRVYRVRLSAAHNSAKAQAILGAAHHPRDVYRTRVPEERQGRELEDAY